jgi:hypothetical protein
MRRGGALPLLALALAVAPAVRAQDEAPRTTVGMRGRLAEVVLPGSALEVVPLLPDAPLVVRITACSPHGTACRYDLEYYALEPGRYDLTRELRRADGTATGELPPLWVEVLSVLPPGQVEPSALEPGAPPALGGYRRALWIGGALWVAGLLAILLLGRRRRRGVTAEIVAPRTLAERLAPLVLAAARGDLDEAGLAELERLLLAHWRDRLGLRDARPVDAMRALRAHPEGGALLRQLEAWLHAKEPQRDVDVAALLAEYRDAPVAAARGEASAR